MLGILTYSGIPNLTADDQLLCQQLELQKVPFHIIDWNKGGVIEPISHLLIRSPWDYCLKAEEFLEFLDDCQNRGINVINNVETVRWNHTKQYLLDLEKAGLPIVESYFFSPDNNPIEIQAQIQKKWPHVVIKPAISGSAYLTFELPSTSREFVARAREILAHGDLMIQPYIESIQTDGEISLIYFNEEYSHSALKLPKSKDFRVQIEHGGSIVYFEPPKALKDLSEKIFKSIDYQCVYARVDLVDCEREPRISELEVIEPGLYFQQHPPAAKRFAEILKVIMK